VKVIIKILDSMNMLCDEKVVEGEAHEILEEIETRLDELGPKWTMEIEVIEA
jgi:hypothetical protein